mmetsp:Transcript_10928/g.16673  ORF Transcript_10928/g.16673 Transcript_10928/m.16673 type:complete len:108 (-) Transcript_10928:505-828(-)
MDLERFCELDQTYVYQIGIEEGGRGFNKLSEKEKYELVYDIVSDAGQYQERLDSSNFNRFRNALAFFIEGDNQNTLFRRRWILKNSRRATIMAITCTLSRNVPLFWE